MDNQDSNWKMDTIQETQTEMEKLRQSLHAKTVEVSVADGAITVVVNGHQQVQSLQIQQTMLTGINEDELHWLQETLTTALNRAIEQSQMMAADQLKTIALENSSGISDGSDSAAQHGT